MDSSMFHIFFVSLFMSIASGDSSINTLQRMLPAYAVAANAESILNSSACARELGVFKDAVDIRKLWALKVLDSSGEPKPGFVYGNNFWLGVRSQCFDTNNENPFQIHEDFLRNASRFRKPADEFPPYKVNYFVAHIRHNSTVQYHIRMPDEDLLTLGLCLPASCTSDQLSTILEKVFQNRTLIIGELYAADFELENVRDLQDDHKWLTNGTIIIVGFILFITVLLMIIGTTYDVLVYQKYFSEKKSTSESIETNIPNGTQMTVDIPEYMENTKTEQCPCFFYEILKCFSMYTNTKIIFDTKLGPDSIGAINGLRFFGMAWLIMNHTVYFLLDFMDNKVWSLRVSEGFMAQFLTNSPIAVDTFFVISAFLLAYLYIKPNLKAHADEKSTYQAKIVEFFGMIFKRFIRLTPAYMMTIGLVQMNSTWYGLTSIFYTTEKPQDSCGKYWWRSLLYIQNFYKLEDICLGWTWYLSNDMQYYILGTIIVILSTINFKAAAAILGIVLGSSTVLNGWISYNVGYVPTPDQQFETTRILYYAPWARIGPFMIGIIAAYILVKVNKKLTLQRKYIVALTVLTSIGNLLVLFGLWKRQISVISTAIYVALNHTVWGIGVAWLLIACCTNNGGLVNIVLSFKAWIPLGKLTYCAYLLNPLVIRSINLHSESSSHVELFPIAITFLGNLVATYLCSYAFSLMMEIPYLQMVRLFTKRRTHVR